MQIFATLSPIPGFMQWLLAKLASQIKLAERELQEGNSLEIAGSAFRESILHPEEEKLLQNAMYVPYFHIEILQISPDPVKPSIYV
jgi:malonyl-CoA decarboxylase